MFDGIHAPDFAATNRLCSFLVLNPQEPHLVRAAEVPTVLLWNELRSALAPHCDGMGGLLHTRVNANGKSCSMLFESGASQAPENLNREATRLIGAGLRVYGRAIVLPFVLEARLIPQGNPKRQRVGSPARN